MSAAAAVAVAVALAPEAARYDWQRHERVRRLAIGKGHLLRPCDGAAGGAPFEHQPTAPGPFVLREEHQILSGEEILRSGGHGAEEAHAFRAHAQVGDHGRHEAARGESHNALDVLVRPCELRRPAGAERQLFEERDIDVTAKSEGEQAASATPGARAVLDDSARPVKNCASR